MNGICQEVTFLWNLFGRDWGVIIRGVFFVYGMAWSFWLSYGMMGACLDLQKRNNLKYQERMRGSIGLVESFLWSRGGRTLWCVFMSNGLVIDLGGFWIFGWTHGIGDLRISRRIIIELFFGLQIKWSFIIGSKNYCVLFCHLG